MKNQYLLRLVALVGAIFFSLVNLFVVPSAKAQGMMNIQPYFTIGLASGEPGYQSNLVNIAHSMMGDSLTPVSFIPSGSSILAREIISFSNLTGQKLITSFSVQSSSLFTMSQLSRVVGDPTSPSTTPMPGIFNNSIVGITYGAGGQADRTGYIIHNSGNSVGVQLNELYAVVNGYSLIAQSPAYIDQTLEAFNSIHNGEMPFIAKMSSGNYSGEISLTITAVPEPSTLALALLGAIPALLLLRPRKS